jgi:hypothetical protein
MDAALYASDGGRRDGSAMVGRRIDRAERSMKCIFCGNTATKMPTILEFLGMDNIKSNLGSNVEKGICEECQTLPLEEFKRRSLEIVEVRRRASQPSL